MLITKISDGLGNQMFQYACGYAQSRRLNCELILDAATLDKHKTRHLELLSFKVHDRIREYRFLRFPLLIQIAHLLNRARNRLLYKCFFDTDPYRYNEKINTVTENTYLTGYWQSEQYFAEYKKELTEIFAVDSLSKGAAEYAARIAGKNSVCVHIRHGDYAELGICLNKEYYRKAFEIMEEQLKEPYYWVFSDDRPYAEQLMKQCGKTKYELVCYDSENATVEDMQLMLRCKHNIIANSSYSWWGAWLNRNEEKLVICPEYRQWTGDFYPAQWRKIPCEESQE